MKSFQKKSAKLNAAILALSVALIGIVVLSLYAVVRVELLTRKILLNPAVQQEESATSSQSGDLSIRVHELEERLYRVYPNDINPVMNWVFQGIIEDAYFDRYVVTSPSADAYLFPWLEGVDIALPKKVIDGYREKSIYLQSQDRLELVFARSESPLSPRLQIEVTPVTNLFSDAVKISDAKPGDCINVDMSQIDSISDELCFDRESQARIEIFGEIFDGDGDATTTLYTLKQIEATEPKEDDSDTAPDPLMEALWHIHSGGRWFYVRVSAYQHGHPIGPEFSTSEAATIWKEIEQVKATLLSESALKQ